MEDCKYEEILNSAKKLKEITEQISTIEKLRLSGNLEVKLIKNDGYDSEILAHIENIQPFLVTQIVDSLKDKRHIELEKIKEML